MTDPLQRRCEQVATSKTFFGHPPGLSVLFFTELWERFSYYGMRALLILFMTAPVETGGLGFSVEKAAAVYGLVTSGVYLLSLPGGWLADRWLGQRKAVLWGGVLIALGNALLLAPSLAAFYSGLGAITAGTGLLKPNVSTIVGQLYSPTDRRRDAGFSIFYMGINLGAFLAPLICGYLGQRVHWRLGFAAAALGMVAGLVQFRLGWRCLGDAGLRLGSSSGVRQRALRRIAPGILAGGVTCAVFVALSSAGRIQLSAPAVAQVFGGGLLVIVAAVFGWLVMSKSWTPEERRRVWAIAVLFFASTVFWSVFEQAGSTLNLFAQRSVRKAVFGFEFPASWFQSLNALFIVTLAPVFAWMWVRLGSREPSSPTKFVLGLLGAGLGFAVLIAPARAASQGLQVSPWWLLLTYFLHTCGELCLSPVGLSAMTKLAPARLASFLMGVWFLSISIGNYLGSRLAALYEALPLPQLFAIVAACALVAAAILAMVAPAVKRMMGEG